MNKSTEICMGQNFRIAPSFAEKAFLPSLIFIFMYVSHTPVKPVSFYSSSNEAQYIYNLL
jgi:hypothetical protein